MGQGAILTLVGGTGEEATWDSDDYEVVSVNTLGTIVGVGPGVATITAARGDQVASIQVDVVANVGFTIETRPALVVNDARKPVQLLVDGYPDTAAVVLRRPDGETLSMARAGDTTRFTLTLTAEQAMQDYDNSESARALGSSYLGTVLAQGGPSQEQQIHLRVLSEAPAAVSVTRLNAHLQYAGHVVNIREGRTIPEGGRPELVPRFYSAFPDDYDYLVLSWSAAESSTRYYRAVRNAISGTGAEEFDQAETYGAEGTSRLQGIIHFDNDFDLAHQVLSHEIGHCCIKRLRHTALSPNGVHWPMSTAAFGVMGIGSPTGPFALTRLDSGDYRVERVAYDRDFNELELYLLGLLPASAVPTQLVFPEEDLSINEGKILQGPGVEVSIDDIIATHGARSPAFPEAQTAFRLATIVVTRAGLLTDEEMAYYDAQAARGEATTPFPGELMRPWYVSTGGRSTLSTSIP